MERKVFTYKDVEEAKKYIGKRGRFSDSLEAIETGCGEIGRLSDLPDNRHYPFRVDKVRLFQFFSPDPGPVEKWVPFTAEDWQMFMLKPMRRVGVNSGQCLLITSMVCGKVTVGTGGSEWDLDEIFKEWEFMDGSPCGKKVTE